MIKCRLTTHAIPELPESDGQPQPPIIINTPALMGCPDIFELDDGSIAVIGIRKTDLLKAQLPGDARCGLDEEIVIIPRSLFLRCKDAINTME